MRTTTQPGLSAATTNPSLPICLSPPRFTDPPPPLPSPIVFSLSNSSLRALLHRATSSPPPSPSSRPSSSSLSRSRSSSSSCTVIATMLRFSCSFTRARVACSLSNRDCSLCARLSAMTPFGPVCGPSRVGKVIGEEGPERSEASSSSGLDGDGVEVDRAGEWERVRKRLPERAAVSRSPMMT